MCVEQDVINLTQCINISTDMAAEELAGHDRVSIGN